MPPEIVLIAKLVGLLSSATIVILFKLTRAEHDVTEEELHQVLTELEDADGDADQNTIMDAFHKELS